ncbi:hypothetical protein [Rhodopila sp.]|uniref:hypothetical protein n=1 Tax=Rhodopila sp. TaxID=2480087 RepID=UPI003D0BEEC9
MTRQALIGAAMGFVLNARRHGKVSPAGGASYLRALLSDLEGCRRLGRQYLNIHPEEADIGLLAASLCAGADRCWPDGPAAVRRNVAERRAADFTAGRITHLDGWLLAQTEARACALVALT